MICDVKSKVIINSIRKCRYHKTIERMDNRTHVVDECFSLLCAFAFFLSVPALEYLCFCVVQPRYQQNEWKHVCTFLTNLVLPILLYCLHTYSKYENYAYHNELDIASGFNPHQHCIVFIV
jgi:hypothetical protein